MMYRKYDTISFKETVMQARSTTICEGTDLCTIDFKDIHFRDSVVVFTNIRNNEASFTLTSAHTDTLKCYHCLKRQIC